MSQKRLIDVDKTCHLLADGAHMYVQVYLYIYMCVCAYVSVYV